MSIRRCALFFMFIPAAALHAQYYTEPISYSSTLEEGIQRGYASIVRSYGMANLLNSQAVNQLELAQKQALENRAKAVESYFELRRYVAEARHSERPTPLSMEQYVRLARQQAPAPLTTTQLDPLTGTINWPTPLRLAQYDGFRKRIEQLFQDRATGYVVFLDAKKAIEEFEELLKADAPKFDPQDLVIAKRFLDSLMLAARGVQS